MFSSQFRQIAQSSDAMLREQFANLRTQIPLMYALMLINAVFLGVATYGEVPRLYSLGLPAALMSGIIIRAGMWILRNFKEPAPDRIRRYLYSTIIAAAVLSLAFGSWGFLLLETSPPVRSTAIAVYIFVGSISCCYCLQALPIAGRLVLLFGAMPVTIRLLVSGDWYLAGIGGTFVLVAGVILRTLATSNAAFKSALENRVEMSALIAALRRSEEHYRHSVDLNPQIPWISDPTGSLTELSPRFSTLTGLGREQSLGSGWSAAVHPDDLPGVTALWSLALKTGRGELADTRYRLRRDDGTYGWYRARAWPRLGEDGEIIAWYGNLEDIDDQVVTEQALKENEERYRLASQASTDVIWDTYVGSDRITWSGAIVSMLGYPEALDGTSREWWLERIHPDDREAAGAPRDHLEDPGFTNWSQEFRVRSASGAYLSVRSRGYVVRDEAGRPTRLIGSLQDVTAQKQYENDLRRAAHYDSLTQLPNRLLFAERLDSALDHARRRRCHVGLVVLDVDRFKTINDGLGHDTGDAMLCEIATRLRRTAPASATVARLGGDEFAIILTGLDSSAAKIETMEKLLQDVSGAMFHAGRQIEVSLSAGVAVAFSDGSTAEELHKSADLALYAAKRESPGGVRGFRREMRDAAEREKLMLSDARAALQGDQIVPFYQPKICLRTGSILGFEALMRWHHHENGLLPPAAIGAAFEDPGISAQITDRMLDRAIRDMLDWRERGLAFGRIAINGSSEDFRRGDFADRILGRLHRAALPPSIIELEVTESVFLGQLASNVSAALDALSAAGVTIALDDFGTGYASLTHLKQFPVDTIKIDQSFVSRLGAVESEDAAIVGAVIDLARSLAITTVAEGIETHAQAAHLVIMGCDVGQGFLFGRPMAAAQVIEAISGWDPEATLALCGSDDWAPALRRGLVDRFS